MAEATLTKTQFCGKDIQFMATSGFNARYRGLELIVYIRDALEVLKNHPVDMLVFETENGKMTIRSAGYFMDGREANEDNNYGLDETTILKAFSSLPTDKFWLKIDDYGNEYVGTFLFPDKY